MLLDWTVVQALMSKARRKDDGERVRSYFFTGAGIPLPRLSMHYRVILYLNGAEMQKQVSVHTRSKGCTLKLSQFTYTHTKWQILRQGMVFRASDPELRWIFLSWKNKTGWCLEEAGQV